MRWAVYPGTNGVGSHFFFRERSEEMECLIGLSAGIQPGIIIFWFQNDGHAVVDRFHQFIGRGGEYSAGI